MGEGKDHKFEVIMHYNSTNSAFDFLDQFVRSPTCMSSTKRRSLKPFFSLIAIACVNAFVLWMLKYPNWQQKKNNRTHLYLLSLGEEMV
jgi:hypothetical protein